MKNFKAGWLLSALIGALPSAALAQDEASESTESSGGFMSTPALKDRPWFFSPMLTYTLADSARGVDDGLGASLALGKQLTEGIAFEVSGFASSLDHTTGDGSATLTGVGVNALIFPSTRFPNIYGLLGGNYGGTKGHPGTTEKYNSFVLDTGVGLLFPIFGDVILRADARFRLDNTENKQTGNSPNENRSLYDDVFSVGVLWPLGYRVAAEPAPEPAPAGPMDSDNDGVPDDQDKCPGTPAGAVVNAEGCEADADGDGVVDRLDQCPDTPAGTKVNDVGCPLDSDGDGVPDSGDDCPDTPAGMKVLPNGCPLQAGKQFVLRGVKFEFDSDRLTPEAQTILVGVAAVMKEHPDVKVELEGHTDYVGTDAYNQGLSERRAASAKRFLTENGVAADSMTPMGYGESRPVATNETAEGREQNRRVEMKVLEGGSAAVVAEPATDPAAAAPAPADAAPAEAAPAADAPTDDAAAAEPAADAAPADLADDSYAPNS